MQKLIFWLKVVILGLSVIMLCVACGETENHTEGDYNSPESSPQEELAQYTLLGELESSDKYLNESNNIRIYGKGKDNLGNYIEIKFVYKSHEFISETIKIFNELEMSRNDMRRYNISTHEDRGLISIIINKKISENAIEEQILYFDQQTFTPLNPEDINIEVSKKIEEDTIFYQQVVYVKTRLI